MSNPMYSVRDFVAAVWSGWSGSFPKRSMATATTWTFGIAGIVGFTVPIASNQFSAALPWILTGFVLLVLLVVSVGAFRSWRAISIDREAVAEVLATTKQAASTAEDQLSMQIRHREDVQSDLWAAQREVEDQREQNATLRQQLVSLGVTPPMTVFRAGGGGKIHAANTNLRGLPQSASIADAQNHGEISLVRLEAEFEPGGPDEDD